MLNEQLVTNEFAFYHNNNSQSNIVESIETDDFVENFADRETYIRIAGEFGFSIAGASRLVKMALRKADFLFNGISNPELDIMMLLVVKDYIEYLKTSGEVSEDEAQLMADHHEIVMELEGYRIFLHRYIRRAMKEKNWN